MRRRACWMTTLVCAVGLLPIRPATAAPAIVFDEASGSNGGNQTHSVGWGFDVLQEIVVTALAWYDEGRDGLQFAHRVGIWSPAGDLLVDATVPAGTAGVLDGQWRIINVAPTVLPVGDRYVVGGENFVASTERLAFNVNHTVARELRFVAPTYSFAPGFVWPIIVSAAQTGFYGPSFNFVPEPATLALLLVGQRLLRPRR